MPDDVIETNHWQRIEQDDDLNPIEQFFAKLTALLRKAPRAPRGSMANRRPAPRSGSTRRVPELSRQCRIRSHLTQNV